jgi:hypothetical protein
MKNGVAIALGILSLIGVGIAVGAVVVFLLLSAGGKPTNVTVGPVQIEIPTSQPYTPPIHSQLPTSTTEPQGPSVQSLGTIIVFGNSNAGIQVQIPQSGIYRFAYRSGAYATYAIGNEPAGTKTWLTAVFIYKGDRALWNGRIIDDTNLFLRLADMKYFATSDEAEKAAQNQYVEMQLNQGDVLTLIGVDALDAYADNPGKVFVEWFLVTY